ncbi:TetR/AcrR family transcriptional regulator [Pelomonas sp. KK5]|uniref:TetR/AcrR family transcriptional regulator n=1 Tax=Pelomonas sp. KK5 TaxID=1855730 RepID=UPI00097C4532|nr:TetR/AcrR family transcriptional regulator [Pelomonas sp. KK5]
MTIPSPTARESTEAQIVEAAAECFERYGIRKTTMDDIAQQAGLSRATLYRYFTSKEAVAERLGEVEAEKVNAELRKQLKKGLSLEATLVECLLLSTRIAHRNPRVRLLSEFAATASRSADPSSHFQTSSRALWGSLLSDAHQRGELAADLSLDEISSWLTLSQATLLTKVEAVEISDRELRRFIQRFIVSAVLR